jgi:hypothetical protein
VRESREDLDRLQALLDASVAGAGAHLREAFQLSRRLDAEGLVNALPGIVEVHLAVLAGDGAPLVAPVDAIFFRGRLWFGLPAASLRARLLRRDPRVSVSCTSDEVALIAHGRAVEPSAEELGAFTGLARELYVAAYGDWFGEVFDRGASAAGGLTAWVEPRVLYARA